MTRNDRGYVAAANRSNRSRVGSGVFLVPAASYWPVRGVTRQPAAGPAKPRSRSSRRSRAGIRGARQRASWRRRGSLRPVLPGMRSSSAAQSPSSFPPGALRALPPLSAYFRKWSMHLTPPEVAPSVERLGVLKTEVGYPLYATLRVSLLVLSQQVSRRSCPFRRVLRGVRGCR